MIAVSGEVVQAFDIHNYASFEEMQADANEWLLEVIDAMTIDFSQTRFENTDFGMVVYVYSI